MVSDGSKISIVRSSSTEIDLAKEVNIKFFGGFGAKVTFLLEAKDRVTDEFEWLY